MAAPAAVAPAAAAGSSGVAAAAGGACRTDDWSIGGASGGFDSGGASSSGGGDEGGGSGDGHSRYRRLDLRLVPYESYFASTLYFTGSDEHNKIMRNVAIERGMRLSEYGLFKLVDGEPAEQPEAANSEEDIFTALGMQYATPVQRDV